MKWHALAERGRRLVAGLALCAAAGCQLAGPYTIEAGRGRYNQAIAYTNNQQLLLNLVRLRYRDNPYFLEVASVSSALRLELSSELDASVLLPGPEAVSPLAAASVAEEPTVTYTPLQGELFVKQLLTPIDASTLLLLYHSGWSIERLFRVVVQRVGGVRNAPSASGPTPDGMPEYERFRRVAEALRALQKQGELELAQPADATRPGILLHIAPGALARAETRELLDLLGLDPGSSDHVLFQGEVGEGVGIVTRSLLASFFYVSQGVEVPARDEEAGRVTVTRAPDGSRFDWAELTGDLLRVRSAAGRPDNTYVATRYRGSWFYIDDADLTSKSTFALLSQLFALQAGEVPSLTPVLTLPVSR